MIYKITNGELAENCYIISKNNTCVIIDPGYAIEDILNYTKEHDLKILAVLLTHGHFDHCKCGYELQKIGIPIYVHKLDEDKLYTDNNLAYMTNSVFDFYHADILIGEGQLNIGDFSFMVLHTPGHSKGGVSYIYEDNIFSGDTLFENGYGRYDFYDGNYSDLMLSVRKLLKYKKEGYKFFYGH